MSAIFLFQAVEINGEHYWDGGYMGNPPIFPLYEQTETHDIMIVQINPIERNDVPDTSPEIIDRLNEISFNSPLILELRGIDFVNRMLAEDRVDTGKYKHIKIHAIDSENQMRKFGASSKSNSDWGFFCNRCTRSAVTPRTNGWLKISTPSANDRASTLHRNSYEAWFFCGLPGPGPSPVGPGHPGNRKFNGTGDLILRLGTAPGQHPSSNARYSAAA
ncbi:patatin-like phospholipase family protein [Undibacterium arcticum]